MDEALGRLHNLSALFYLASFDALVSMRILIVGLAQSARSMIMMLVVHSFNENNEN